MSSVAGAGTGASFRHRLQLKQNALHIQTQNIPPPPSPSTLQRQQQAWSATASVSASMSASTPISSVSSSRQPPLSPRDPPRSPRVIASAAVITGQSRFVEGSMSDRVSTAPPPGFLGFENYEDDDLESEESGNDRRTSDDGDNGSKAGRGRSLSKDGVIRKTFQRHQQRRSEPTNHPGGGEEIAGTTSGLNHLRRPKSTAAGWLGSSLATQAQEERNSGGVVKKTSFLAPLWDGVREKLHLSKSKSSGSIGRMMTGMVERKGEKGAPSQQRPRAETLSTTAYPSREEVMESYRNLVASGFFEAHAIRGGRHPLRAGDGGPASPTGSRSFADHMASSPPASPSAGTFSDQIMPSQPSQSFADRMAARQLLRQNRFSVPPANRPADLMGPPPSLHTRTSSSSSSSSSRIGRPPRALIPGALHLQRGTKRAPSLDFAIDAEMVTRKLVKKLRHSASRVTLDLAGAQQHHHHHQQQQQYRHHHSYSASGVYPPSSSSYTRSGRSSTSSDRPEPLSPTGSIFSCHGSILSPRPSISSSTSRPVAAGVEDDTRSLRQHKKLTKSRRRILGITRRTRSPSPQPHPSKEDTGTDGEVEMQDAAAADAMMLDEPAAGAGEERRVLVVPGPNPSPARNHNNNTRPHRIITPPPTSFFSFHHYTHQHHHPGQEKQDRAHHEPLSVVPDPNQGIPSIPRIPRQFCDAMVTLAPPPYASNATVSSSFSSSSSAATATAAAAAPAVGPMVIMAGVGEEGVMAPPAVGAGSFSEGKLMMMDGVVMATPRDSGLGGGREDVENIPVWA
ncbi:hypothetical protein VTJ83DRAFT_6783 [Remersonia thermophila]|uniref:Uncharacterized protein n=1 Tax=Remersonia thermophila TaxID=72144 RepID=A0ABR4D5P6_9PEZI